MRQSLILTLVSGWLACGSAAPVFAQNSGSPGIDSQERPQGSCLIEVTKAEGRYELPPGILLAISLAESGRRDPVSGMLVPWPYTINAHGSAHFYDSIDDAVRETAKFLSQDDAFVDVGCMQVDLFHHPHAFRSLAAAFDPETNIDYAARYLRELYQANGSWTAAVAAYHAGNPDDGADYLARVLYLWRDRHTTADQSLPAPGIPGRRGFTVEETPNPLDLASQFLAGKDFTAALSIYKKELSRHPASLPALLGAAECQRQIGRLDEARSNLERALTADPANALAMDSLIRLIETGPAEKKMTALLAADMALPKHPELLSRIALIEAERGQINEATTHMAEAVRISTKDPILLLNYALLLDRTKQSGKALQAYRDFLDIYRPGMTALTVPLQQIRDRYNYLQRKEN
ncbi:MAG TPA: transglycosylase SLT domain-containing protein [Rhodospirillaceae bacterium]|nr:transglycosylase SLT domain-containing protein [Rhodospirillaceae bacterium]